MPLTGSERAAVPYNLAAHSLLKELALGGLQVGKYGRVLGKRRHWSKGARELLYRRGLLAWQGSYSVVITDLGRAVLSHWDREGARVNRVFRGVSNEGFPEAGSGA